MTALEVSARNAPPRYSPADLDVLRALKLDPELVHSRALILVANRYNLDPLLRQVRLIPSADAGTFEPYIGRDGMVQIAHRSGHLDGMVTDELRRGETGFACTFSVWRNDMSHAFTYRAGCGHHEYQAKRGWGAEQALARAERRALIRAFAIPTSDVVLAEDVEQMERIDPSAITVDEPTPEELAAYEAARETAAESNAAAAVLVLDNDQARRCSHRSIPTSVPRSCAATRSRTSTIRGRPWRSKTRPASRRNRSDGRTERRL